MRLGNGIHRRTPVWVSGMMLTGGLMLLPGAAPVLGQESAGPLPESGTVLPNPIGRQSAAIDASSNENIWTLRIQWNPYTNEMQVDERRASDK